MGHRFDFAAGRWDDVARLKIRVAKVTGIAIYEQLLSVQGSTLEDPSVWLTAIAGIRNGAILTLALREDPPGVSGILPQHPALSAVDRAAGCFDGKGWHFNPTR